MASTSRSSDQPAARHLDLEVDVEQVRWPVPATEVDASSRQPVYAGHERDEAAVEQRGLGTEQRELTVRETCGRHVDGAVQIAEARIRHPVRRDGQMRHGAGAERLGHLHGQYAVAMGVRSTVAVNAQFIYLQARIEAEEQEIQGLVRPRR